MFKGPTTLSLLFNVPPAALSPDRDGNWIPDECTTVPFRRGDVNVDGEWNLSDAITVLGRLFPGNPAPLACEKSADPDDSGALEIWDALLLLWYLFLEGLPPAEPFMSCGFDPTADPLGCNSFPPCR